MAPFRASTATVLRTLLPLAALGLLGLTGCDSSDDGPAGGCLPPEVVDGPLRTDYPTDNIGRTEGETLENLSFTTPEGETFELASLYEQPGNKLLMVVTASGWCTACIEEQPKLQELHDAFSCQGLAVMVAVFQDQNYEAAVPRDAENWQRRFDLTFPVLADEGFVLSDYYDESLTPMVMLVDAETMEIVSIETGYNEANVRAVINAYL